MTQPFMTSQQVAKRLQVTTTWFYKNRARLEAEGFPPALPGFRQGRWSAEAIDAWAARASGQVAETEVRGPTPEEAAEEMEKNIRNLLRARGQKIARRQSGHA